MHFNLITVYQGGLGGPLTQLHSLDQEFSFQLHYDYILAGIAVHCVAAFKHICVRNRPRHVFENITTHA